MSTVESLEARYRADVPHWGHLPAAMRLKQALVQALGVEGAFEPARRILGLPHAERLERLAVRPLRELARATPGMVELWRGRPAFERPDLRVQGAPPPAALPGTGRDAWLACVEDATVRSRSALVLCQGSAWIDVEADEAGDDDEPAFDPTVLQGQASQAWIFTTDATVPFIPEAFSLLARNAVDFGHWLTDYLPRYVLARLAGMPATTPLLLDAGVPATVLQHLRELAPEAPQLTVPPLEQRQVGRLWIAPGPILGAHYPRRFDDALWSRIGAEPFAMARLLAHWEGMLGEHLRPPTDRPRVLFARKPGNAKKRLLNREGIEAQAVESGFERVYPEDLPLHEQIRLARHAQAILAPEGSNALLSWFASPGCRVCLLSPPYTLPLVDLGAVMAARGVTLEVIAGPGEAPADPSFGDFWNDYRIEPGLLAAWLAELPP